jgi:hypothetical protein
LTAWLTGGAVDYVVLHPLQISWTKLSRNPHPQLVAWGGPIGGALMPLALFCLARLARIRGKYLFQFFAGFCLIANGLYLIVDSFGGEGDGGTLLKHGASKWELLAFGILTIPLGFWLWHGIGRYFGLGPANGRVNWQATASSVGLLLAAIVLELVFYGHP